MEKAFLREVLKDPQKAADLRRLVQSHRIVYADPMDLTKMLDRAPGTAVLDGVRDTQALFYPA